MGGALFIERCAVRDVDSLTQISGKLISKIAATRDSTQIQNELRKHTANLKKLSRYVVCDIRFVELHLDDIAKEKLMDMALVTLPQLAEEIVKRHRRHRQYDHDKRRALCNK